MKSVLINVNLKVVGWPITGTIECEFIPCPPPAPQPPAFTSITSSKGTTMARTFTAQISNLDPSATSVPSTATFNDGSPPQNFDALPAANGTFTANDGVQVTLTGTQNNSAGASPASTPVNFVAAAGVIQPTPVGPPTVPAPPLFVTITGT